MPKLEFFLCLCKVVWNGLLMIQISSSNYTSQKLEIHYEDQYSNWTEDALTPAEKITSKKGIQG